MATAYIVDAVRTAGGRRNGKLAGWHPVDLAAATLDTLVARTGMDGSKIDDVIMGCVTQAGQQAMQVGRNAVLASKNIPDSVPAVSVAVADRVCKKFSAERSAVIAAVMAGAKALRAAAVCSDLSPPAAPCGMCRQTLAEFASDCEIVLCGPAPAGEGQQGEVVRVKLSELLPRAFSPASLHAFAQQQRARSGDGSNG